MARLSLVAALALTGSSSALQIPLQLPFDTPWTSHHHALTADDATKLPLVDSETLQSKISSHTLESRSKVLYDIAKKGEEEYGHPTRVIGSAGEFLGYTIKAR
jgi:aminopeptidase Y